jgi:hypothetical protein
MRRKSDGILLGRETFLFSSEAHNITLTSFKPVDTAMSVLVEILAFNGPESDPLFSQLRSIRSIPRESIEIKGNTRISATPSTACIYNRRDTNDEDGWKFINGMVTVGNNMTGYENNVDSYISVFGIILPSLF